MSAGKRLVRLGLLLVLLALAVDALVRRPARAAPGPSGAVRPGRRLLPARHLDRGDLPPPDRRGRRSPTPGWPSSTTGSARARLPCRPASTSSSGRCRSTRSSERMGRGDVVQHTVVVPEGLTARRRSSSSWTPGSARAEAFRAAFADTGPACRVSPPGAPNLEGFLFPDTYRVTRSNFGAPGRRAHARAVPAALHAGAARARPRARADAAPGGRRSPRSSRRRPGLQREAPIVAGVYLNRLDRGMRLQADPTVTYALKRDGRWTGLLHRSDYTYDSPYNTYLYDGLPPGPICNPGIAALTAAVTPARTEYFYFVADAAAGTRSRAPSSSTFRRSPRTAGCARRRRRGAAETAPPPPELRPLLPIGLDPEGPASRQSEGFPGSSKFERFRGRSRAGAHDRDAASPLRLLCPDGALGEDALGRVYRALRVGPDRGFVRLRILESPEIAEDAVLDAIQENGEIHSFLKNPAIARGVQMDSVEGVPFLAWDEENGRTLDSLLAAGADAPGPHPPRALAADRRKDRDGARSRLQHDDRGRAHAARPRVARLRFALGRRRDAPDRLRPRRRAPLLPRARALRQGDRAVPRARGALRGEDRQELRRLFRRRPPLRAPDRAPAGSRRVRSPTSSPSRGGRRPLPPEVTAVLKMCLSDAASRYQSSGELRRELGKLLFSGPYSPSTFNLAYFLNNVFAAEIETETRAREKEGAIEPPRSRRALRRPPRPQSGPAKPAAPPPESPRRSPRPAAAAPGEGGRGPRRRRRRKFMTPPEPSAGRAPLALVGAVLLVPRRSGEPGSSSRSARRPRGVVPTPPSDRASDSDRHARARPLDGRDDGRPVQGRKSRGASARR